MKPKQILSKIFTLGLAFLIFWMLILLIDWSVLKATFAGESQQACHQAGACWVMVSQRFNQFMFGFYPQDQQYRISIGIMLILLSFFALISKKIKTILKVILCIVLLTSSVIILHGGLFGLKVVPTDKWGGLFLTLFLSLTSILCASPLALILALGRYSKLLIARTICITFIETVRGVPLISVLFMASVMLPFFLPPNVTIDKLLRAFLGLTLFQSAYLAEVIRGGLNAISKGQIEAGQSLGMSYWQIMSKIVLPQALVLMIPGIVNSYIALFKDTTLVLIIGLYDLLGIVQAALTDPNWLGLSLEAYIFCAVIYWAFCFSMSLYSKRLETKLKIKL